MQGAEVYWRSVSVTFMEQGAVVMSSPLMTHQVHLPAIKKAIVWERPLRVQGKDRPLTLLNGTSRYLERFKGPLSYLAF